MHNYKLIILLIVCAVAGSSAYILINRRQVVSAPSISQVVIQKKTIRVELAITPAAWEQGLMGRRLAADQGMLFIFPQAGPQTFWMKNMLIPLDIVWIANHKITGIVADAPPAPAVGAPILYQSPGPVDHVLEVNAGTAAQYDWQVGDLVTIK